MAGMSTMDELIKFLRARLDEDEALARGATEVLTDGTWITHADRHGASGVVLDGLGNVAAMGYATDPGPAPIGEHIARHDPARVLREVAAKRAIVAEYESFRETFAIARDSAAGVGPGVKTGTQVLGDAVQSLAAVWSGHEDYRPEWAP